MLQGLGKKGERDRPETALERLESCHARIRHFLQLCNSISTASAPDEEVQDAAREAGRYFGRGFGQHVLDEDQILFPALSAEHGESAARLQREHERDDRDVASLCDLLEALGYDPGSSSLRADLATLMSSLGPRLEDHLREEEQVLFPWVAGLPRARQDELFAAMQARRQQRH